MREANPLGPGDSADFDDLGEAACMHDFVDRGVDVDGGRRVTDGFVSFVVPIGWVASRVADCFCLFRDLNVGFVRATPAHGAAGALLETGRLQVVAEVKALSSPVFVGRRSDLIQVRYASFAGAGIGCVFYSFFTVLLRAYLH